MFIIYGTKAFRKDLGYTNKVYHCNNCNNNNQQLILRNRKFFTLYWIPLIPFSSKYYVSCPVCGAGYEIRKADAMSSMAQIVDVQAQPQVQAQIQDRANTTYLNGSPIDTSNSGNM
ncbi:MAG: zinc-ribbon domain-containing protein [Butyrivibrio sp.]|nr:zinc-ribbon domain-containing protein [Butyrivibrio sp.]